jgi:hypothetical protein
VINILPWILAFLYDALLYLGRMVWHEIPVFGGRARGENRPRAPSLRQRAAAGRRRMSIVELVTGSTAGGTGGGGAGASAPSTRQEWDKGHEKSLSRTSIPEEQKQEQGENT